MSQGNARPLLVPANGGTRVLTGVSWNSSSPLTGRFAGYRTDETESPSRRHSSGQSESIENPTDSLIIRGYWSNCCNADSRAGVGGRSGRGTVLRWRCEGSRTIQQDIDLAPRSDSEPGRSGTSLTAAALSGLACTAPIDSTAVGQLQFGTNSLPIAEHWDGRTWSSDNVASAAAENNLAGVSCSSAVFCVAVGSTGPYAEPIKQPSSSSGTGQHGQASRHPTQGMSLNPRWDRQWSAEASSPSELHVGHILYGGGPDARRQHDGGRGVGRS